MRAERTHADIAQANGRGAFILWRVPRGKDPGEYSREIAAAVRAELARAGKGPTHLEQRFGHTRTYWWRRLKGGYEFSMAELSDIADWLNISVGRFLP